MIQYRCRIIDQHNKEQIIFESASSENSLIQILQQKGFHILDIKEVQKKNKNLSKSDAREFIETIALLTRAKLNLKDALKIAQVSVEKSSLNAFISTILEKINKGISFSDAIEEHKASFPPIVPGLIKIGERIGNIDVVLERLNDYIKTQQKFRDKILGALTYPSFILGLLFIGLILLVTVVLPKALELFAGNPEMLETIPRRAYILLGSVSFIFFIIIGIYILRLLLIRKKSPFAAKLDELIQYIPILGKLAIEQQSLYFCFSMETLVDSGISLENALLESANVVSNTAFRNAILEGREAIMRGESLSNTLSKQSILPKKLSSWIGIGEHTGQTAHVFGQLREYYSGEVEKRLAAVMAMVEPLLITFVGIIIIFVIFSFIVPIFEMQYNF